MRINVSNDVDNFLDEQLPSCFDVLVVVYTRILSTMLQKTILVKFLVLVVLLISLFV